MPIYEYKCRKCGRQFEAFQGITDPELKSCKFCKGKVAKLVSMSSFSLKGSGWYATDYGGKKSPAPAISEKASETTSSTDKSATGGEAASTATSGSKED
ncbi:MAG: zinc ribbon domain-containing protein [Deltaproteobacteria bacterium HGW-Deltaproteobacteria-12]|jgi:putative FmdB family regulatory protein|nr:MAG: zinc ribbon domain-containing protein [Deltaproteobacteria bacterium HGW-Deltaproteobacteria-12]